MLDRRRFLSLLPAALAWAALPAQAKRAAAVLPAWPHSGRILFDVLYNGMGTPIGSAEHLWAREGERYSMSVEVRSVGLLAMLKPLTYVQRSGGTVRAQGLVPETFSVEQSGRQTETAHFDWAAGRAVLERHDKRKEGRIERGDQDVLSIWHQLARLDPGQEGITMNLVSNKAVTPVTLTSAGEEGLDLPLGRVAARHLRLVADDDSLSLDVWLDPARAGVPVRVRLRDRKGEVLDHLAREISYSPVSATSVRRS